MQCRGGDPSRGSRASVPCNEAVATAGEAAGTQRAERNSKAMRVKSRSLVLTLSTRAFERPWVTAASMPERCSVIDFASFTNEGIRHRRAHFN